MPWLFLHLTPKQIPRCCITTDVGINMILPPFLSFPNLHIMHFSFSFFPVLLSLLWLNEKPSLPFSSPRHKHSKHKPFLSPESYWRQRRRVCKFSLSLLPSFFPASLSFSPPSLSCRAFPCPSCLNLMMVRSGNHLATDKYPWGISGASEVSKASEWKPASVPSHPPRVV